ncbi:hypothetical protein SEA_ZETA1847_25 [Microbacterium phage Zeta1847]|uniref:Uncharacterized protein n=1 Tax=Microbacterium phage Zeta1847 TaxID=2201444 RepID=A0A2Z4Q9Z2_9CAUD|nr:hypothetical protein HOT46_gp25 [Microbacterium phage Zeta1847]AWY06659.1 hypothetical protein SEA_ZETA1847_25 [Microbacterium phage Zeta1847]
MRDVTGILNQLSERAQEGMRAYMQGPGPLRTMGTKQAAAALVEARELFQTREGEPDLLGQSYDYREWVSAALDKAGVPKADRTNLQAAIRHHVSPMLREKYGDELKRRGLEPGSTVERRRSRRNHDAKLLSLFAGGAPVTDLDDATELANYAARAVNRIQSGIAPDTGAAELAVTGLRRLAKAANDAARRITP